MALIRNNNLMINDGGGGKSSASVRPTPINKPTTKANEYLTSAIGNSPIEQAANRYGMSYGKSPNDGTVEAGTGKPVVYGKTPTAPTVEDDEPKYDGGGGGGSGSGSGGTKKPTSSIGKGYLSSLLGSNATTTPTTPAPTEPQVTTEDRFNDLKNRYNDMLRQAYEFNADKLAAERDASLREQYISQRQTEASLPERLAALGATGGAANSILADIWANYQGNRNNTRAGYMSGLGQLAQDYLQGVSQNAINYDTQYLNHKLDLEKMAQQFEYDKLLKQMNLY